MDESFGVLIDDKYGQDALNEITGKGWWVGRPVELPGSRPLEFEVGDNVGMHIGSWPKEQVVKCLVFYHPDDELDLRLQQQRKVAQLYRACVVTGHRLMLEVIPPAGSKHNDMTVADAVQQFYDVGVFPDWWKLPAPSRESWKALEKIVTKNDPNCSGVIILGLDAPIAELAASFSASAGVDLCKGFAVGRTIFGEPAKRWLAGEFDDSDFVDAIASNYESVIDLWRSREITKKMGVCNV